MAKKIIGKKQYKEMIDFYRSPAGSSLVKPGMTPEQYTESRYSTNTPYSRINLNPNSTTNKAPVNTKQEPEPTYKPAMDEELWDRNINSGIKAGKFKSYDEGNSYLSGKYRKTKKTIYTGPKRKRTLEDIQLSDFALKNK